MAVFKKRGNWWIDYYVDGRRRRERVGPSHKLALDAERKRKLEIAEGKFFPERLKPRISFGEAADLYWELHAKHKPSAPVTRYHLGRLKAAFGGKRIDQVLIPDVLRYLNDLRERTTAATANRHLAILKSVFNRAIEWERFAGPNPAAKVKPFRVENSRLRFLDESEISRLLSSCSATLYPVVVCALLTGMRRGEILRLDWSHVDLEQGILYVLQAKSGRPREIPISSKLRDVLRRATVREGRVFDIAVMTLRRHFTAALKAAGIDNFRFHDLRHTFASHFVMRTNDLPAAQKLLGHETSRMTQRYAHLAMGHLKVGIEKLDAGLGFPGTTEKEASAQKP